jgi:Holliday junction resolvase RusA-like endonuclease
MTATIYGKPVGKPRMTRRDKWQQRPCVLRYRAWCDLARLVAFGNPFTKVTLSTPTRITVVAYFAHKTRRGPHTMKPDADNITKAVKDALFINDEMVYREAIVKYWDPGKDRIEVEWKEEPR